ncbi:MULTISPECIES: cold shock domain-containing protein [unclassified Bradyrhizobium]|uniref:cold-shock protein n=1 Tax=unclassified Bradyrhizobium TaxID=2631580 RepID=UPI001CD3E6AC|nr:MULTISPECIES: cold shock domain-containing protein [unclassified Bradyrhizobium]
MGVSYNVEKGWGFIRPDDGNGKDLFVHISGLCDCEGADLVPGTRDIRSSLLSSSGKRRLSMPASRRC